MNKLVEEIVKPLLTEIPTPKVTKIIGIYGGRFQPFGPHHLKTYKWLSSQVDDAYISTSNIKKPPRHPMNFKEKVRHMTKMGVPSSKIIEEKSPYVAKNLAKKFDEETTVFVYVFGKKDTGRLGGSGKYFQDYKKNKENLKGHKHHGYYLVAPHVSMNVDGKEVSGTSMRELLGSQKIDDKKRVKLFKKMFGYFNKGLFNMLTNKFKKLSENIAMGYPDKEALRKKMKKVKKARNQTDSNKEYQYNPIDEDINIPVKVGDTILVGKFKNKKMKIKDISTDKHGMPTINGRKATTFRIHNTVNIFDEDINEKIDYKKALKKLKVPISFTNNKAKLVAYLSTNPQVLTQLLRLIGEQFSKTIDMKKIIKEASSSVIGADDGPSSYYGNFKSFRKRGDRQAERLGFKVIDYIMKIEIKKDKTYREYPDGPVKAVSYLPSGIGTGGTPNNQENLVGTEGYNKWKKHIRKVAEMVGMKLIDYMETEDELAVKKDSIQTIKKQREEEKTGNIQESTFSKSWWKEQLLTEGGAYGHMAHPFDDSDLTFGDLKKIITNGLGGNLSREDNVTEKLDGQNIMVSWKDGKLIAARNKGHIKNGGKTALDAKGIASKFAGRGDIKNAFVFAMKDLEKAIKGLSQKQKDKIFNNGYNFMNMEVMWPKSANVIDYDKAELVFHGALKYNDNGKVIGEVPGSGRILAGMIKQINQHIQKKYSIDKPVFLDVPKHQDFGKMKSKFLGRLSKLQSEFGLKDNDTLGLYHQSWWERFIINGVFGKNYKLSKKILEGLTKRWAFFDKSYTIPMMKKDIKEERILNWVLDFDKKDHASQVKNNMRPFEVLFFEVGVQILKNVKGFMAANPDKAVQNMRKKLDKAINTTLGSGDKKKLNTLYVQLDRLNAIGGTKAIVPSEGIVFKYKGKTYKFTGAFAPVNQITGLINF